MRENEGKFRELRGIVEPCFTNQRKAEV